MGVPFFASYLIKKYGAKKFYSKLNAIKVKEYFAKYKAYSLSLDLNGVIHNVAARVYHYGDHELKSEQEKKSFEHKSNDQLELELFQGIADEINKHCELIQPCSTLTIAVDGPACVSKQYQQRQRRFKAKSVVLEKNTPEHYTRYACITSSTPGKFDSNCITPGTPFMERLNVYLQNWIQQSHKSNKSPLPDCVIYSGHRSPGEGEHKISKYLREMAENKNLVNYGTNVVVGLDADLIMLGMLSPMQNYTLFREDKFGNGATYDIFDIKVLRDIIAKEYGSINDFVLLTFLAGNDFLPSFPSINIKNGDLTNLLNVYVKTKLKLTDNNAGIDWNAFALFLEALKEEEKRLLINQYYKGWKHDDDATDERNYRPYPFPPTIFAVNNDDIDMKTFEKEYYDRALGLKNLKEPITGSLLTDVKKAMTEEWISSMAWVFKYYHEGSDGVNTDWAYHFNYPPLISDIVDVLKEGSFNTWPAIGLRSPVIKPYEQLISVLPPASKGLLPVSLQPLLSPNSEIGDMFPTIFLADLSNKIKDHEAVALLPYIEPDRARKALENVKLTPEEEKCNTFEFDKHYKIYSLSERKGCQRLA